MAKLHTYGSSPNFSFSPFTNSDWVLPLESLCHSEFGIVDADPFCFEGFNDLPSSTIYSDIKKMQSDSGSDGGGLGIDFFEQEIKPKIRNIDCMWSGGSLAGGSAPPTTATDNTTATATNAAAVPLTSVIENAQNISNNNRQRASSAVASTAANSNEVQVKLEPSDNDYEQQLQQHSIPNSRVSQQQQLQSMQHIKPGMSLLRKSNVQQQQHKKQQQQHLFSSSSSASSIKIPAKTAAEFLRERDPTTKNAIAMSTNNTSASVVRPDTPLSLDDDPSATEFKHNVDLRACVMGSNNISLVASHPSNIINNLSEQLQDTTRQRIDLRSILPDNGAYDPALLADVFDLIVKDDRSLASTAALNTNSSSGNNSSRAAAVPHRDLDTDDDDDEDDEDYLDDDDDYEEEDGSSCGGNSSATSQLNCTLLNRSHSSSASLHGGSNSSSSYGQRSPASSLAGGNSQQSTYPMLLHSDHSYTRCNDDLGTNLETPSDSDEEIDVVSIGDKKLPNNPSDKDRRALQTKVAHKFSNALRPIVKTANGVRTIPPRRRVTVELPYTPASSSPVKSVANSRYVSPSATPYQMQYTTKYMEHMLNMQDDGMTPASTPNGSIVGASDKQRKRMLAAPGAGIINGVEYLPPGKKHRGGSKKQKHAVQVQQQQQPQPSPQSVDHSGDMIQRHFSMDEAADTLEKRNLHNDMERQRRIGLKNLFEALKKQIPSIKDKERAPKVNILREAAKLCESLGREDQHLNEQKAVLKEQLRKRQELLARLRAGMQRD